MMQVTPPDAAAAVSRCRVLRHAGSGNVAAVTEVDMRIHRAGQDDQSGHVDDLDVGDLSRAAASPGAAKAAIRPSAISRSASDHALVAEPCRPSAQHQLAHPRRPLVMPAAAA